MRTLVRNTKPGDRVAKDGIYVFASVVHCLEVNYYLHGEKEKAKVIELTYGTFPVLESATSMHASPLPWFVLSSTAPDSFAVVDTAMTIEWSGEKLWKDHLADLRACRTADSCWILFHM